MIASPSVPFMGYWQKWAWNKIHVSHVLTVFVLSQRWFKVWDRESEVALSQNILQKSWFCWFGLLVVVTETLQCLHTCSQFQLCRATEGRQLLCPSWKTFCDFPSSEGRAAIYCRFFLDGRLDGKNGGMWARMRSVWVGVAFLKRCLL